MGGNSNYLDSDDVQYTLLKDTDNSVFFCERQGNEPTTGNFLPIIKDLSLEECRDMRKGRLDLVDYCSKAGISFSVDVNKCNQIKNKEEFMCYVATFNIDECMSCSYTRTIVCSIYDNEEACSLDPCVIGCKWDSNSKCVTG